MKKLNKIKAFILVSEFNSFKAAADQLCVSTTAVSKQIQSLESELNKQLFIRSTRHIQLTEFGRQYYPLCKKLEADFNELEAFAQSQKLEPQGKLKVLIQNSAAKKHVFSRLRYFMQLYPKIELEFDISERRVNPVTDNFDIIITYSQIPDIGEQLESKKFMTVKHQLYASPNFIKQYGMPQSIAELTDYNFIIHSLRKPDNFFDLANGEKVLIANPHIKVNNFEAMIEACCNDLGIVLALDALVEDDIAAGKLVPVLPDLDYQEFDLYMYYFPMKYETSIVKVFCDFIRSS